LITRFEVKNPWVTWMAFAGEMVTPGVNDEDEVEAVLDHIPYLKLLGDGASSSVIIMP